MILVLEKYTALVKEFLLVKKGAARPGGPGLPTKEPLMIMAPPLTAPSPRIEVPPELHAVIPYMKPSPEETESYKPRKYEDIYIPPVEAQQKFSRRLMSVGKRKTCRSSI